MATLNFHQLHLFYKVAQVGNFSRAADELFITQPAISAQIREFETNQGVRLFERNGRTMQLTEAGKLFYRYAHEIFGLAQQLEQGLEDLQNLATGRLNIAASTTAGEVLLPQVLGRFKASYPGIKLELYISNTADVIERILKRQFDLGFVGSEINQPDLVARSFYQDEIVLFVAADHPLAARPALTVADLNEAQLEVVMREQGSATRVYAEKALKTAGLDFKIAMGLGSNEAVKGAVRAGLGVGMLSCLCLETEFKAGLLKRLPVAGLHCLRDFSIIYRKDKELSLAEKRFLDLTQIA